MDHDWDQKALIMPNVSRRLWRNWNNLKLSTKSGNPSVHRQYTHFLCKLELIWSVKPNSYLTQRSQSKIIETKISYSKKVSTLLLELQQKQSNQQAGQLKWSVWGKQILDLVVCVAHCGLGSSGGVKKVPSACYQHTGWGPGCWTTVWADPKTSFPSGTQPAPTNMDSGWQFPPGIVTFQVLEIRYFRAVRKRLT